MTTAALCIPETPEFLLFGVPDAVIGSESPRPRQRIAFGSQSSRGCKKHTGYTCDCTERVPQTTPKKGSGSLPSRGSKNHHQGMCRPCRNFASEQGCSAGSRCNFCHYRHDETTLVEAEKFASKKRMRRALQSALSNNSYAGNALSPPVQLELASQCPPPADALPAWGGTNPSDIQDSECSQPEVEIDADISPEDLALPYWGMPGEPPSDPARALEALLSQFGGDAVAELLRENYPTVYED